VRVVSLVPSATETILELGVPPVACTRFCQQPGLPTVGGTKDPDVAAVIAARPDLVVVNNEENRRADADALLEAGLTVHDCSPRSVADVGPAVAALAEALGVGVPEPFATQRWRSFLDQAAPPVPSRPVVTFVWRRPWMTMARDTYGASVLERLGLATVEFDEPGRYPSVTLDAVRTSGAERVLLPSEPYPFRDRHVAELERELPAVDVRLVDGRDLFWWGARTPAALGRLRDALS
jgi:ABC-type Fe3+-hydroxamate transport system substrate-binding protein